MYFVSIQIEKEVGTAKVAIDLFMKNFFVQFFYTIFYLIVLYGMFGIIRSMSVGFFPAYFVLLTAMCMKEPNKVISCCTVPLLNKYYPVLLLVIFCLMNGTVSWDLLIGYILGMAGYKWPQFAAFMEPRKGMISWLEIRLQPFDGKIGSIYQAK